MNWSVKTFVDEKTGRIHRVYRYKDKICRKVILQSRLCAQLAGWALIEKDLRSAISWMDIVDELNRSVGLGDRKFSWNQNREVGIQVKGLFVAALTFYFKCFSKCEGRPVKLERAQLEEAFREVHDHGVSLRNNFAAHSGSEKAEQVKIALVMPEKLRKGRDNPMNLFTELMQPDHSLYRDEDKPSWQELFEHCREVVKKKMDFLVTKILKDEVLPKGAEHWAKQMK